MSDRRPRIRAHALSVATAIALTGALVAPAFAQQARINLSGLDAETKNDRFIVKYRDGSAARANVATLQSALDTAARGSAATGKAPGLKHVRRTATGADVVRADRKLDRVEAEALMRQIAADPSVDYIEVDKLNKALLTPNDTRYSEQWGYSGTYGIKANQAWDVTNGAGAVVAVLDTGITSHSDLNANVLPGYDFIIDTTVSNDGNGRDSDASDPGDWVSANQCGGSHAAQGSSWHGTHVAGTIAAVTNNAKGVAGVAYGAKIVPVRVLGTCGGYDSDIADAIIWASGGTVSGVPANANPAEVINLSLGGSGACGTTTQNAINGAVGRGTTLVIAAGNDNVNVSNASPANCANVIAVASITSTGARSSFSNYGSLIDIAAPGSNILSTLNSGSTTPGSGDLRVLQRHLDGDAARGRRGRAAAGRGDHAQDAGAGGGPHQGQCHRVPVDAVADDRPGHPQRQGRGRCRQRHHAAADRDPAHQRRRRYRRQRCGRQRQAVFAGRSGRCHRPEVRHQRRHRRCRPVRQVRQRADDDQFRLQVRKPQQRRNLQHRHGAGAARTTCWCAATRRISGLSLTGSYTAGGGGGTQTYTNGTDFTISDNATVDSPITVSGRSGNAPTNASVTVAHRAHLPGRPEGGPGRAGRQPLQRAQPQRRQRRQHQQDGARSTCRAKPLNGTWKLRVNDNAAGDTGYINSWSVTF